MKSTPGEKNVLKNKPVSSPEPHEYSLIQYTYVLMCLEEIGDKGNLLSCSFSDDESS